jgi:hypothetical protein
MERLDRLVHLAAPTAAEPGVLILAALGGGEAASIPAAGRPTVRRAPLPTGPMHWQRRRPSHQSRAAQGSKFQVRSEGHAA